MTTFEELRDAISAIAQSLDQQAKIELCRQKMRLDIEANLDEAPKDRWERWCSTMTKNTDFRKPDGSIDWDAGIAHAMSHEWEPPPRNRPDISGSEQPRDHSRQQR